MLHDCEQDLRHLAAVSWAGRPGAALGDALLRTTGLERMLVGAFDASGHYRLDRHPSVGTWGTVGAASGDAGRH